MAMTIAEKILARASGRQRVSPGEIVEARIDVAMINDITGPITVEALEQIGVEEVWDPSRVVIVLDHQAPSTSIEASREHSKLRRFAAQNKIRNFFDVGEGICHQVLPERGFALPGELVVGADSHTCTYGAFGCFATGIGSTDMAAVFATGKLWFRVPESMLVKVEGRLGRRVTPKDAILKMVGDIGADGATYRSIEFSGSGMSRIGIGGRMTMCNMGVEMGAKTAIVPADEVTEAYLRGRARWKYRAVNSDQGASYVEEREYDLSRLEPQVALPHNVDRVRPVREVAGVKVDQAFLGSCTNGRLEDLIEAAKILKGRRIAPGVRMLVVPASREIYLEALKKGVLQKFVEAGAVVGSPSCAACMGGHIGILGPGEVCISSSNRNFRGRMGSPEAEVYLGSPATVAASALKGEITDPRDV
ncbi:MAG: 3-isopropylmalate dehydratase large subunit [Candidatus Hadarchaeum yellowstonense]|jgi:3-isopropylmalate/(R)-2-methylmalate dehydratase large subunit|uniref:3-isopropylmalate dehydratase large subunit n=1 Tax=Hadarchaeum yellowstonense TaxID=1776334 RepID=A0A147JUM1_HADYE|nr:MAG: 3-isopropylmalate dehydratase large subunit [Candidatus Hadarchaeum yellowstonense]